MSTSTPARSVREATLDNRPTEARAANATRHGLDNLLNRASITASNDAPKTVPLGSTSRSTTVPATSADTKTITDECLASGSARLPV